MGLWEAAEFEQSGAEVVVVGEVCVGKANLPEALNTEHSMRMAREESGSTVIKSLRPSCLVLLQSLQTHHVECLNTNIELD